MQLVWCVVSFVKHQADLAEVAIQYLLSHWPQSPSLNELIFLEAATLIVQEAPPATFGTVCTFVAKPSSSSS